MNLHPGSFVQLGSRHDSTYQVVSIDDHSGSCWVRRWPLSRHGSPPFSVPLQQVKHFPLSAA